MFPLLFSWRQSWFLETWQSWSPGSTRHPLRETVSCTFSWFCSCFFNLWIAYLLENTRVCSFATAFAFNEEKNKQKLEHSLIFIYSWFCCFLCSCVWEYAFGAVADAASISQSTFCFMNHQQSMKYRLKIISVLWAGALSLLNHAEQQDKILAWCLKLEGNKGRDLTDHTCWCAMSPDFLAGGEWPAHSLHNGNWGAQFLIGRYTHYSVCPCGLFHMFYPGFDP